MATGRQLAKMPHDSSVVAVAFSPDGTHLATAGNAAGLCEVATGRGLAQTRHSDGWAKAFALSPDLTRMATGSTDHNVLLWEVATGRQLAKMTAPGSVTALAFNLDGSRLATAGGVGAELWEVAAVRRVAFMGHDGLVVAVAFSSDGTRLATASADETARLWAA